MKNAFELQGAGLVALDATELAEIEGGNPIVELIKHYVYGEIVDGIVRGLQPCGH